MSSTQPAPSDRQLPRGHLLVLNRSFRRTLEAENKSPRTIEAYTDAVRLLATYCQTHGHPILADGRRSPVNAFVNRCAGRTRRLSLHARPAIVYGQQCAQPESASSDTASIARGQLCQPPPPKRPRHPVLRCCYGAVGGLCYRP